MYLHVTICKCHDLMVFICTKSSVALWQRKVESSLPAMVHNLKGPLEVAAKHEWHYMQSVMLQQFCLASSLCSF